MYDGSKRGRVADTITNRVPHSDADSHRVSNPITFPYLAPLYRSDQRTLGEHLEPVVPGSPATDHVALPHVATVLRRDRVCHRSLRLKPAWSKLTTSI